LVAGVASSNSNGRDHTLSFSKKASFRDVEVLWPAYLAINCSPLADQDTYLVVDDFGQMGCAWRETDVESADCATLIRDLVDGQYSKPVRIVAFNFAEGWCRNVTTEIADELRRRHVESGEVPDSILGFIETNRR
jgi:hypothetical protein